MAIHINGRLVEKQGTPAAEMLPPHLRINFEPDDYDGEPLDSFIYPTGEEWPLFCDLVAGARVLSMHCINV